MKFLIFIACALATVSAGDIVPLTYHNFYHGSYGVHVATPAVQRAKSIQMTLGTSTPVTYPVQGTQTQMGALTSHTYYRYPYGSQHIPVIGSNGVPVDTPAVQHAKAVHFAHKVHAHARNGDNIFNNTYYPGTTSPVAHEVPAPATYPTSGTQIFPVFNPTGPIQGVQINHVARASYAPYYSYPHVYETYQHAYGYPHYY